MAEKSLIGEVTYVHAENGIVKILLTGKLSVGDTIIIEKGPSQTKLRVDTLSIEGITVEKGFGGDIVELKINARVEPESSVYKL